jgi:hypothetical protein
VNRVRYKQFLPSGNYLDLTGLQNDHSNYASPPPSTQHSLTRRLESPTAASAEELIAENAAFAQASWFESHIKEDAAPRRWFLFGPPEPESREPNESGQILGIFAQQELPTPFIPTGLQNDLGQFQFGSSQPESRKPKESGQILGSLAQQELPAPFDPTGLQNDNSNHASPTAPIQYGPTQRLNSPAAAQSPLLSVGETSHDLRLGAHASLEPVSSSEVFKARRNSVSDSQQRPGPSEEPSDTQPPTPDVPRQPSSTTPVPPRRSKRLQELKSGAAEDLTRIPAVPSVTGGARSGSKRIAARSPKSGDSAKPRGVSKRCHSTTKRRRVG